MDFGQNIGICLQILAIEKIKEGTPYVLRFKSEGDYNKKIIITDLVKGKLELPQDDQRYSNN